jgi:hypothetical protein
MSAAGSKQLSLAKFWWNRDPRSGKPYDCDDNNRIFGQWDRRLWIGFDSFLLPVDQ